MMKTLFVEKNILSRDIQNIFLSLSLKELKGKWIIDYFLWVYEFFPLFLYAIYIGRYGG